jgi:hypothetical protein
MPILRYFSCVGAGLLALLFLADASLPRPELRSDAPRHGQIRIASRVTGPAPISFSGHAIDYGATPAIEVVDFSARLPDPKTQALAQATSEVLPAPAAKPAPQKASKRYARRAVDRARPFDPAPQFAGAWGWSTPDDAQPARRRIVGGLRD